jgi:hypothetical protein
MHGLTGEGAGLIGLALARRRGAGVWLISDHRNLLM